MALAGRRRHIRKEAYQVDARGRSNEVPKDVDTKKTSPLKTAVPAPGDAAQNVSFAPTWAAKGMPTVVPGPKKSPRAPAGTSNCLPLVTGTEHAGVAQRAVTFAGSFTRTVSALISPTQL